MEARQKVRDGILNMIQQYDNNLYFLPIPSWTAHGESDLRVPDANTEWHLWVVRLQHYPPHQHKGNILQKNNAKNNLAKA